MIRTSCELLQLLLQGDGSVVRTENFSCKTVHQLLKMFVQDRSLEEKRNPNYIKSKDKVSLSATVKVLLTQNLLTCQKLYE